MTDPLPATDRTTIGRIPGRGTRDRAVMDAILDEGLVCHVGLQADHGPVVLPTTYARRDDELLLHGAPAATWLRSLGRGTPVCVTVTHVDGLVLARSGFHHSLNYRSVVVFGTATPITDPDDKRAALDAIVDHVVPGRTAEIRGVDATELATTIVLRVPLSEASVKVRTGGPVDDPADLPAPDVWAGVVPLSVHLGEPEPADDVRPGLEPPASVRGYHRPG